MSDNENKKTVFAYVHSELHRRLKLEAAARDMTQTEIVIIALNQHISEWEAEREEAIERLGEAKTKRDNKSQSRGGKNNK